MRENGLDMIGQNSQLLRLGVGSLGDFDFGSGIADNKSWIVAFAILLVLTWLARWTMRPARRAAPTKQRDGAHETDLAKPAPGHAANEKTLAKQTRKA